MGRWWGIVFFALAACEPEPKGPVQVERPEAMHFETEKLRREVERFRESPSAQSRLGMERAFGALDERVRGLEALAQAQSGEEKTATEQQIADLKRRRELHGTRAQTALVESQPVQRAEPIAERVIKAERVGITQRARQAERARMQRMPRETPRYASPNFFERLFR
ncbi:MAG: hypothetical protein WCO68_08190 [Verrucomicrobiota bacterium]